MGSLLALHSAARQFEIAVSVDKGIRGNLIGTFEMCIRAAIEVGAAAFSMNPFGNVKKSMMFWFMC